MPIGTPANLLIEFLTEELPPTNLENDIGNSFSNNIASSLRKFIKANAKITTFVSPRRFGCIIHDVAPTEADTVSLRTGPAISNGLKDGNPTPALLGFAKSCGLSWQELSRNEEGYFYTKIQIKGKKLDDILPDVINTALKKLPIAKNMRWGNNDYSFVRPIHNILILHGTNVIANHTQIMGLTPNNHTLGHRIMSTGKITIHNPDSYIDDMLNIGHVMVGFSKRREVIKNALANKANSLNLEINHMPGLLDEVTALVEYPVILEGKFNPEFLQVPQECLILSMAKNQKYFALLDNNGKLSNQFLFVANIKSSNPEIIIRGNEKVLAARLQDAKFFFDVDKKNQLATFVDKLSNVVYHNKLGSQKERIVRLQNIASNLALLLNIDPDTAKHTAYLLKADLASEMVGEFPELQGIMGKYYAEINGETAAVANAIEKHYYPRFSGDELPDTPLATVMALADKLETLVGIWGIGLIPTGDKDPFALRRAALGVIRILLRDNLDICKLLEITYQAFGTNLALGKETVKELYTFIISRLENYLVVSYKQSCIKSVLSQHPSTLSHIPSLLDTLNNFAEDEKNSAILQANKRIENILNKNGYINNNTISSPEFNKNLLKENAEIVLAASLIDAEDSVDKSIKQQDWNGYFRFLSSFNQPVTDFFDNIMVMVDDEPLQKNRIALLVKLYRLTNKLCKLSELG